jgi:hypothetical protein
LGAFCAKFWALFVPNWALLSQSVWSHWLAAAAASWIAQNSDESGTRLFGRRKLLPVWPDVFVKKIAQSVAQPIFCQN